MRIVRRGLAAAMWVAVVLAVAAASIAVSLWLTPMQTVTAAGQTIRVGVTAPSWTLSGPGELDLFGQHIPTLITFVGPVRPRLVLTHITLTEQLNQFVAAGQASAAHTLEQALVSGWERFFTWQVIVAGLAAIVLSGAVAGWLRRGWRRSLALILVGLVVTEGLNLGAIMVTAYTAPDKLRQVDSLTALVGAAPTPQVPQHTPAGHTTIERVAVVGDSTAAGLGNRPVRHASAADTACGRSRDAFAVDLAEANGWQVTNLACSGATIRAGLLGPQQAGGQTLPPQLGTPAVAHADLVVVSIGANDVNWSLMLRLCAASHDCADTAEQALFQQQLALFSKDLLQLVSQLQLLPNHPVVIVNQYYDPFAGDTGCLSALRLTEAKKHTLQADLAALNEVLAQAAQAAGFRTARPDFTGHGPCSRQPYVQGPHDPAPFHPSPSGELAIALADEHALYT